MIKGPSNAVRDTAPADRSKVIDAIKESVAREFGLPVALASRLVGETPEELREDAERLAQIYGELGPVDDEDQAAEEDVPLTVADALRNRFARDYRVEYDLSADSARA